jgi:hypothetical protein
VRDRRAGFFFLRRMAVVDFFVGGEIGSSSESEMVMYSRPEFGYVFLGRGWEVGRGGEVFLELVGGEVGVG